MYKICFIIAMEGEAKGFINKLDLKELVKPFPSYIPVRVFQNNYHNLEITLLINGKDEKYNIDNIGTQAAVLTSYLAIKHYKPDLVINAGTAGAFRGRGLEIADVVIAQDKVYFHDRRIPIPVFREYGLGAYPLKDQVELISDLGLKSAIISTGNAFDFNKDDEQIMSEVNASLKDMEAASIAWLCDMANIPLMIIKSVTDFVDHENNNEEEFTNNFNRSVSNLTSKILEILEYINNRN